MQEKKKFDYIGIILCGVLGYILAVLGYTVNTLGFWLWDIPLVIAIMSRKEIYKYIKDNTPTFKIRRKK